MQTQIEFENNVTLKSKYSRAKIQIESLTSEILQKTLENSQLVNELNNCSCFRSHKIKKGSFQSQLTISEIQRNSQLEILMTKNKELRMKLNDCSISLHSLVEKLQEQNFREKELEKIITEISKKPSQEFISQDFLSTNHQGKTTFENKDGDVLMANKENETKFNQKNAENLKCLIVKTNDIISKHSRQNSLSNKNKNKNPSEKLKCEILKSDFVEKVGSFFPDFNQNSNGKKNLASFNDDSKTKTLSENFKSEQNSTVYSFDYQMNDNLLDHFEDFLCSVNFRESEVRRFIGKTIGFYKMRLESFQSKIDSLQEKLQNCATEKDKAIKQSEESMIAFKKLKVENLNLKNKIQLKPEISCFKKEETVYENESGKFQTPQSSSPSTDNKAKPNPTMLNQNNSESEKGLKQILRENQETHLRQLQILVETINLLEEKVRNLETELESSQKTNFLKEKCPRFQSNACGLESTSMISETIENDPLGESSRSLFTESFVMLSAKDVPNGDFFQNRQNPIQKNECEEISILENQSRMDLRELEIKYRSLLCNFQEIATNLREAIRVEEELRSDISAEIAQKETLKEENTLLRANLNELLSRCEYFENELRNKDLLCQAQIRTAVIVKETELCKSFEQLINSKTDMQKLLRGSNHENNINSENFRVEFKPNLEEFSQKFQVEKPEQKTIFPNTKVKQDSSNVIEKSIHTSLKQKYFNKNETSKPQNNSSEFENMNMSRFFKSSLRKDRLLNESPKDETTLMSILQSEIDEKKSENNSLRVLVEHLNRKIEKNFLDHSELTQEFQNISMREFSLQTELETLKQNSSLILVQTALFKSEILRLSKSK